MAAIKAAQRPVIIPDRGAVISGAREALEKLAEKIQAPVVAMLDAKDIMVEDHPLFRGCGGLYGRSGANHVIAEADLVIYAGSNTGDHTTANWKMPKPGTAIIQIDIDPVEIGRNYSGVIGMQSDVRAGLEALAAAAPAAKHDAWLAQSKKHCGSIPRGTTAAAICPARAARWLPRCSRSQVGCAGTCCVFERCGSRRTRRSGSVGWAWAVGAPRAR